MLEWWVCTWRCSPDDLMETMICMWCMDGATKLQPGWSSYTTQCKDEGEKYLANMWMGALVAQLCQRNEPCLATTISFKLQLN